MSRNFVAGVGLSKIQRAEKRCLDIVFSLFGLVLSGWLICIAILIAGISTRSSGVFVQTRIGQWGKPFSVFKIATMKKDGKNGSTVTTTKDVRVTKVGRLFRKTKLDELPQLVNVLFGQMSFVGPRPDVPGFADLLIGSDRAILTIKPGITGPASIAFKDEEELLAAAEDPEEYNRTIIYPKKVKMNLKYIENYSIGRDIRFIIGTLFPFIAPRCRIGSE